MGASTGGRLITLARIGRAHGLRGEVKIEVLGDRAGALAGAEWMLVGATQLDARRMAVESLRGAGGKPILKLAGVSDKDEAAALGGLRVFLPRCEFPPPAAGEFYQADLVGLRVLADGEEIGRVAEIVETPAFDVLVVRPDAPRAQERLIPFTRTLVKEARPDEGVLLVHGPALREAEGEDAVAAERDTKKSGDGKKGRAPRLRIDLLTLFPGIFDSPFDHSLLSKATLRRLIDIRVHDIREEGEGRHRITDDAPYGGGDGMVMMAGPVLRTIKRVRGRHGRVILLSPTGKLLDQATVRRLASERHLVIVCGRYGGIDERVGALGVDEEISIGDYVLGGGEPAAIALVDAVARLVPGVVGNAESTAADSFEDGLLEYPQFTRPASVGGLDVPEVLLGGDHAKVARWRRKESMRRTLKRRPDLLARARLSKQDELLLAEVRREEGCDNNGTRKTRRVAKPKEQGRP